MRELASEGAITSEVIYNALADATPKLQAMFDKMPVTMSQSFGVLRNNYKKFVGDFVNDTTGLSGVVAKSLLGIANNFETLAKGSIAVTGVALVSLASRVTLTTTAFSALGKVVMAHPVVAMTAGVVALASAFMVLMMCLIPRALFLVICSAWLTWACRACQIWQKRWRLTYQTVLMKAPNRLAKDLPYFSPTPKVGLQGLSKGLCVY